MCFDESIMEKIIQLKAKHIKTDTLVLKNLLQTEIVDETKRNQDQQQFNSKLIYYS